ncbi:transglycosylase family protein [Candidatus Poriferisocius sp.]|uniref:transglycosylase family protein n=1 Tax=Candidatus Poriferisocius sp. TaxID=3101276 RepID=UPI003B029B04
MTIRPRRHAATLVMAVALILGMAASPAGSQAGNDQAGNDQAGDGWRDDLITRQEALISQQEALIVAQESLLNNYRCLFDIDTQLVPGGCADSTPVLPAGTTEAQWEQLRQCESGGNYQTLNPAGPYLGAYQFLQSTWNGVAERHYPHLVGVDPRNATPTDQDRMAYRLHEERGWQPWPACAAPFRAE